MILKFKDYEIVREKQKNKRSKKLLMNFRNCDFIFGSI